MKKPSLLKEEILYYLSDAWEDSLRKGDGGMWLTTRALQLKLEERGIITTWPTLYLRMSALLYAGQIEKINTSNGTCWKPVTDILKL